MDISFFKKISVILVALVSIGGFVLHAQHMVASEMSVAHCPYSVSVPACMQASTVASLGVPLHVAPFLIPIMLLLALLFAYGRGVRAILYHHLRERNPVLRKEHYLYARGILNSKAY